MRYISFIITLFLLSACEHDALHTDAPVAVRLIPSLDDSVGERTRVIDTNWQASETVGVSIDNSNYKQYKTPASIGTSVTLTPSATDQTLYYPTNGNSVTFRAFCPYKAPSANVVTYNTFGTQNTSASMQAVDLVYHSGATGNKNSATVSMNFKHQFSKIVITVAKAASVTNDLSTLAMTLTGMPTSTTFDLSGTGTLGTATGSGTITPLHNNNATTGSAMAIIPPHVGKTGRAITFAVGSLNYSYSIPDGFEFKTGESYAFNFTLSQTAVALTSSTITNWSVGTIAWDGNGNSLTAPTEVTHYQAATNGNTITIKTNHSSTPAIEYSTSATTVTGSSTVTAWLTGGTLSGPTGTDPKTYTLTYNVAATSAERTGYIHIKVGTMTVVTKVTQLNIVKTGLTVTPNSISDPSGEGISGSLAITSGYVPTLDFSEISWLSAANVNITYVSGTNWKLNYTLPANTTAYRDGKIKVLANTDSESVDVSQVVIAPNLKINNVTTAVTIADDSGGGITGTLNVTCHKNYTPTITTTSMLAFNSDYTIGTVNKVSDGNYTITYTLKVNSTATRNGYIIVTAGSMSQQVNFTQEKQTIVINPVSNNNVNCFIVAPDPNVGISFTLSQANRGGATLTGTLSVSVLWKDTDCINDPTIANPTSGVNAVITIKPKSTQGNALIAIKNSSGTILWSYHIWVSNINLNNKWTATGGSANTKKTFMDRNLGATANTLSAAGRGLFYQWGRKDPFPATDISGFSKVAGPVTDIVARQNPDKIYYGTSGDYDWLSTPDVTRWDQTGNSKSVHDPCPAGWRVPTSGSGTASPWYGLANPGYTTGVGGGINWGTNAAFPAAGYRYSSSGNLNNVGSIGYYWSATVTGGASYYLYFNGGSGYIYPSNTNTRASGFSVRCVAE